MVSGVCEQVFYQFIFSFLLFPPCVLDKPPQYPCGMSVHGQEGSSGTLNMWLAVLLKCHVVKQTLWADLVTCECASRVNPQRVCLPLKLSVFQLATEIQNVSFISSVVWTSTLSPTFNQQRKPLWEPRCFYCFLVFTGCRVDLGSPPWPQWECCPWSQNKDPCVKSKQEVHPLPNDNCN